MVNYLLFLSRIPAVSVIHNSVMTVRFLYRYITTVLRAINYGTLVSFFKASLYIFPEAVTKVHRHL